MRYCAKLPVEIPAQPNTPIEPGVRSNEGARDSAASRHTHQCLYICLTCCMLWSNSLNISLYSPDHPGKVLSKYKDNSKKRLQHNHSPMRPQSGMPEAHTAQLSPLQRSSRLILCSKQTPGRLFHSPIFPPVLRFWTQDRIGPESEPTHAGHHFVQTSCLLPPHVTTTLSGLRFIVFSASSQDASKPLRHPQEFLHQRETLHKLQSSNFVLLLFPID